MANNYYGKIKIEFNRKGSTDIAVTGTDCIMRVDARWGKARAYGEIEYLAKKYIALHPHLEWNGLVYKFGSSKTAKVTRHGISFV